MSYYCLILLLKLYFMSVVFKKPYRILENGARCEVFTSINNIYKKVWMTWEKRKKGEYLQTFYAATVHTELSDD